MATDGKAPVMECVQAGFSFFRQHATAIAPMAALTALATVLAQAALGAGNGLAANAVATLITAPFLAGLFRVGMAPAPAPRAALAFDRAGLHLAGAAMAISFFVLIMMLVGFFAIAFVLGAQLAGAGLTQQDFQGDPTPAAEKLSDALGQQGMMIFGLMLGVILVAAIWVNARLILAGPATVAEGRMLAFTTWSWTKGNGWRIVAALILTCMPGFLVSNLVASLVGQAAGLNREQLNAPGTMVTAFVASFLVLWLVYGPFAGLSTYLYRGFRPQT